MSTINLLLVKFQQPHQTFQIKHINQFINSKNLFLFETHLIGHNFITEWFNLLYLHGRELSKLTKKRGLKRFLINLSYKLLVPMGHVLLEDSENIVQNGMVWSQ